MCHIQSTTNDLMTAYTFLGESKALFNTTVKHDRFVSLWDSFQCLQRLEDYGNAFVKHFVTMEVTEICFCVDILLNK